MKNVIKALLFFVQFIFFTNCSVTYDDLISTKVDVAMLQKQVELQNERIKALEDEVYQLRNELKYPPLNLPTQSINPQPFDSGTPPSNPGSSSGTKSSTPREQQTKPAKPAESTQCQATTKKGKQCSRKAKAGSSYCWQHGG